MLTLNVPRHWNVLLGIDDIDEYDGPLDVEPDDVLRVQSEGTDERYPGVTLEIELCSGQTNYWYTFHIWRNGELECQSEPSEYIAEGKDTFGGIEHEIILFDEDDVSEASGTP